MADDPRAWLAALAADPDRVASVPAELLPFLIGECAALQARLIARLTMPAVQGQPAEVQTGGREPDRLLSAGEAAQVLGVSRRWVYRHSHELPVRRLPGGALRFSSRGLERWAKRTG